MEKTNYSKVNRGGVAINKRKIFGTIIGVLFWSICVLFFTYAYYEWKSENTSVVTTILDTTSAVSIEISNINKLALVKGDGTLKNKAQLKLTNIPIDTELTDGETIYTSGIGNLYKKGIPVGTISKVINKRNDIDRYGIVDIFVDIDSLSLVGVIIN